MATQQNVPEQSGNYGVNVGGQPIQQEPSAKEAVLRSIGRVLGDSGTKQFAGYVMEDYNPEWQNSERVKLVEDMRRGDAACAAALKAIRSPLLGTQWHIHTSGSEARDEEIRLFVEQNLFKMRCRSWEDFLREGLKYLDFGHYAFELIWEIRDGQVWLHDMAPRIPRSIQRWKLKDGTPGIVQYLETDDPHPFVVEIPMDKLLVLTHDKEGDDVTGMSALRAAYKHYYLKEVLYKIQTMAAERFGVGIPTITMAEGAGADDQEAAEDMGRNTRANEEGYVVLPFGWVFKITTPEGNPQSEAIISAIDHHSKMILMSVFAQFLGLGTSSGSGAGSYALSKDQSSFFLEAVKDMGRYFVGQINKQVIKKIVDVNFGEQETYPELRHDPLGEQDIKEFSEAMSNLANAGFVQPNARTMKHVNDVLQLPEMPDDELEAIEERDATAEVVAAKPPEQTPQNIPGKQTKETSPDE